MFKLQQKKRPMMNNKSKQDNKLIYEIILRQYNFQKVHLFRLGIL